jgi:uncharacterized protein YjcR
MKDLRIRRKCKALYLSGLPIDDIARMMNGKVGRKSVYNWKLRDRWDAIKEENLEEESKINEAVLGLESRVDIGLSRLALDLLNKAKKQPTKTNLEKLKSAMSIYDAHFKSNENGIRVTKFTN